MTRAAPTSPTGPTTKVAELYGLPTSLPADWKTVVPAAQCPFLGRVCQKTRKSDSTVIIGTCTMLHGRQARPVLICPFRLLERRQVFHDCQHLLALHEPGNELRVVAEVAVPGGNVDYCLVSVRDGRVRDFVGIELQTLDTTGTVWPERQRFLQANGILVDPADAESVRKFGMNWKHTAKTTLGQLHHKVTTFDHLCKRFVLVLQDHLLDYLCGEYAFDHIKGQRDGDPMQFHVYELRREPTGHRLNLKERLSTDVAGTAKCLGLKADMKVELQSMLASLEAKLPQSTPLPVGGALPVPETCGGGGPSGFVE
jgi:hypothetical protein